MAPPIKRYTLDPVLGRPVNTWMVEDPAGRWGLIEDMEPVEKGGLSVKAATQIDALLQSSISAPTSHDPLALEAHQFELMMFGITEDIKRSILAGKMVSLSEVERDAFSKLLTAFLRHELKSLKTGSSDCLNAPRC